MDPQTLLMAVVAFVVIIISLYIMSVFGMQEKTYEEVIAEQRRLNAQAEQRSREGKKDKKKDKRWKKGKDKDKMDTKSGSDSDTGIHKMVELELEPEIIEPIEVGKSSPRSEKPAPNKKAAKSILHNKAEKPVVSKSAITEETFHPEHMPRDEVEMKYERQQSVDKELKTKKKSKEVRKEVAEEAVIVETITAVSAAPPVEKKPKTKSKESGRENVSRVMTVLNESAFTEMDLQILIDYLLEKQGAPAHWTKSGAKGDPLTVLKKQLEDKERQLSEEQQQHVSAGKKIKDLKQELAMEKQRLSTLDKKAQEQFTLQQEEIRALHARMQQSHDQHRAEMAQLQSHIQQSEGKLTENQQSMIHRLQEDHRNISTVAQAKANECNNLQQQLKIIQVELSNSITKLNAAEGTSKNLDSKVKAYEERMKQLDGSRDHESALNKKVNDLSTELRKAEQQYQSLNGDLQRANSMVKSSENETNKYKTQVQDLESETKEQKRLLTSVEQQLKETENARNTVESQMTNANKQLQDLKQENHRLTVELQTTTERQAGEGQEAPNKTVNGEVTNEDQVDKTMIGVAEHEKIINEKNTEVSRLQLDLEGKLSEMSKIKEDLELQRKKNNELEASKQRIQNDQTLKIDALSNEISTLKGDITLKATEISNLQNEVEAERKQYTKELEERQVRTKEDATRLSNSTQELNQLKSQLETKNIDLNSLKDQLEALKQKNAALEFSMQKAEEDKNQINSLRDEIVWFKKEVENRVLDIEKLERELATAKKANNELFQSSTTETTVVTTLRTEIDTKITEINTIRIELEDLRKQNDNLVAELNKASLKETIEGLLSPEDRDNYEKQLREKNTEIKRLREDLDKQQQLYDEFREKNEEVSQKLESANLVVEEQKSTKDVLQKMFPMVTVEYPLGHKEWLVSFEKGASKYLESNRSSPNDAQNTVNEFNEDKEKLQKQVDQYKTVLGETENMLTKLQSSVESEEKKWKGKLEAKNSELAEVNSKLSALQSEPKSAQISDEMEGRIQDYEKRISQSESEKKRMQTDLDEANKILKSIKADLEEARKNNQIPEDSGKQLEMLSSELEQERKAKKDVQAANTKLNSQLKMGQAAYKEESEKVKQLEQKLTEKNQEFSTLANLTHLEWEIVDPILPEAGDTATSNNSPPPSKEVEELKAKLAQKEQQLQKEVQAKRQLNQRLAASVASKENVGTSV